MVNSPVISVITPVYKPGKYIDEYFASLQNQSLHKDLFEVVIILNGPKHPYMEYINERLKELSPEVNYRIFYHDEPGICEAENIGIDEAKGQYVTFIDCDDYISPKYLEDLYELRNINHIIVTDCYWFDDLTHNEIPGASAHELFQKFKSRELISLYKGRNFLNSAAKKMIPIGMIGNIRFKNIPGMDSLFMFSVAKANAKFLIAPDTAIYHCRMRNASVSHQRLPFNRVCAQMFKMLGAVSTTYLKAPLTYSFTIYLRTMAATVKAAIKSII